MGPILRLDVAGIPDDWISAETAAGYYATGTVAWALGDVCGSLRGGINRVSGVQSRIDLQPIIAIKGGSGASSRLASTPSLSNLSLFKRDRHTCAYCGTVAPHSGLTRDHIVPLSRGGKDQWMNVVAACKSCNSRKGADLMEELGWKLLYVPYKPNLYEGLLLRGRKVLACQHEFLMTGIPDHSRLQ